MPHHIDAVTYEVFPHLVSWSLKLYTICPSFNQLTRTFKRLICCLIASEREVSEQVSSLQTTSDRPEMMEHLLKPYVRRRGEPELRLGEGIPHKKDVQIASIKGKGGWVVVDRQHGNRIAAFHRAYVVRGLDHHTSTCAGR